MNIGIVYEDFHSEVVEFILEILQFGMDTNITVYNNTDRYDNIDLYQKNYNRMVRKSLSSFIVDLNNGICDKYIIITFSNIIIPEMLSEFREKLIFIAHDSEQLTQLKTKRMNYIVLSKLLTKEMEIQEKWKCMLPICKNSKLESDFRYTKQIETQDQLETRMNFIKENKLKPILLIGHFFRHNKNIKLIKELLETKKVYLFVFVPDVSNELQVLLKEYQKYMICGVRFSTRAIEKFISDYNISHLLFAPPKDSNFFKTQWSGSIAFGLNRGMTLIMPEELAEVYLLQEGVIGYKENTKINSNFVNNLDIKDTEQLRNKIHKRNSIVLELLLTNKYKDYNFQNGYFIKEKDDIGLDNTEKIIEEVSDNSVTCIISPKTSKLAIDIVTSNEKNNVILFNKDLSKCLEYKHTAILYNYDNKIRIFNEDLMGPITLDTFDKKINTIVKEGEDISEVLISKKTIKNHKPKIVLISKENSEKQEIDGHIWKTKELFNTNLDKFKITEWINVTKD
jgi:hypothetical protein